MPRLAERDWDKIPESEFVGVDARVLKDELLAPSAKVVYAAICARAGSDARETSLRISDIAREACCSRKTAQESLKALALRGVIETEPRFNGNRQTANFYRIIGHRAECYENRADSHTEQRLEV
ncbi:MAG: helix-turn-helix domain-containing protein [Synergistaceae bacterium]|jgi:hypothetical protein|nr:helix-turn-helix domain-containing protein [Synergistaceae bacterium]